MDELESDIKSLQAEKAQLNTEVSVKAYEIKSLNKRLGLLESEILQFKQDGDPALQESMKKCTVLEDTVKAERESLVEKELEFTKCKNELQDEVDRLNVVNRRLDKKVQEYRPPEVADACLSARSFEENQLIKLRDEAIVGKTKEVFLLQGQSDRLQIQLDELDGEMSNLQNQIIDKNDTIERQVKEMNGLKKKLDDLVLIKKQAEGREKAMEVAMEQNENLLKCLQAQEIDTEKMTRAYQETKAELQEVRGKYEEHLKKSSVWQVEAEQKEKQAELKLESLTILQQKVLEERKKLHDEMKKLREDTRFKVETMEEELCARREKQYQLMQKLQTAEANAYKASDGSEAMEEELQASRLRMVELEKRLADMKKERDQLCTNAVTLNGEFSRKERGLKQQIESLEDERDGLRRKYRAAIESAEEEKQKNTTQTNKLTSLKTDSSRKDKSIEELKQRVARMIQEATREGKARAQADINQEMMNSKMENLRQHMQESIDELNQQISDSKSVITMLTMKSKKVSHELFNAKRGKLRIVASYARYVSERNHESILSLSECCLTDIEVEEIARVVIRNPQMVRLELRDNIITDHGAKSLAKLLTDPRCIFEMIDLQKNKISILGIRILAAALQNNPNWQNTDVHVQADGKIQVVSNTSLTIDVRNNDNPDLNTKPPTNWADSSTKSSIIKKNPPKAISQLAPLSSLSNQSELPVPPLALSPRSEILPLLSHRSSTNNTQRSST